MASKRSQPLFHTIIDNLPIRAINCATLITTKVIASENSHPLHIKIMRKLAAFDPKGFYWRVNCHVDISKKSVVRNECRKDCKNAFVWALAEAGWGPDGRSLNHEKNKGRLTGAVLLAIAKDPERVLTAKKADLRREAQDAVRKILSKYERPAPSNRTYQSGKPARNSKWQGSGQSVGNAKRGSTDAANEPSFTRFRPAGS